MKVICAPDSFKESLSATEAAEAMAEGVRRASPAAQIDCCPIGDGGEGSMDALIAADNGQYRTAPVMGPLGESLQARWGLLEGGQLAVIEMAAAAGLMLVPADKRDAAKTTTYGVGQLILAACDSGVERLIVGVGGSATNDGGSGMAQALGIRFFDTDDVAIDAALCGGMLLDIARIEVSGRNRLLDNVTITVASDVDNPLTGPHGATHVFGSQKGATPAQIEKLDAGLNQLAQIIHRDLGLNVEDIPGAGAAGGLGGGLIAFAGATIEPGIRLVLDAVGFDSRVRGYDLCLTGEGCLDAQSLSGKACLGVARAASKHGVPTIALVGCVELDANKTPASGLADYVVIGAGRTKEESIRRARELLADAAERIVRQRF